ncbi:MAG: sigma-70 family RNA polymerase sigma factor [Bacteroidia bacterium]|nr:sigma-70 family RNA polymerase sigma factor [Bacteroidia bacterium]MCZ2277742.1 sigma-70 family RNA polymerase sigma factor [Bacteroidia bacterium]
MKPNFSEKAAHDYQLIQQALNNADQSAYAELMDRYRDSIYFMLLKMVNNRDDADDLTIEAFGKAFKKLRQYTPDFAFSTWLFKIATNNCIDFIRKKKKMIMTYDRTITTNDGSEIIIEVRSERMTPEEELIREQKIKIMREVVEQLKPRYRQLVELRYFKEYSYEEIAEIMKLPLGTVKAQLFRAREFLFQIISNQSDEI